jgi:signal peptidase I
LATQQPKQLWKNEYFRTAITILIIVTVVFAFWFGSRWALNTDYPMLAVATGSMAGVPTDPVDDGWSHPFDRTLRIGDLIIVQGVRPEDVYAAPFNESGRSGDILVFHAIGSDELIVHRAIGKTVVNGHIYFITQGDHNNAPGPSSPTPAENVVGKVIMRIPWLGHLALFMQNSSVTLMIAILIVALIIIEFVLPGTAHKRTENNESEHVENAPETKGTT